MEKLSPFTPKQEKIVKYKIKAFFNQHYNALGESKTADNKHAIRSVRTFHHHLNTALLVLKRFNVRDIQYFKPKQAKQWLNERKDSVSKRTLQNEKRVLERMLAIKKPGITLALPGHLPERQWTNRAYSPRSVEKIMARQKPHTRLSTQLCYRSGLRAQELLTLRRLDEQAPSTRRQWRDDLFKGLDGVKYVVNGKGGLLRAVMVPHDLAEELERRRLATPKTVIDRGVKLTSYYDISGGKRFSDAFSKLSKSVLGYSRGAHGLRYDYAQNRMFAVPGGTCEHSLGIVSQELGHFRPSITEHYLNPCQPR